MENSEEDTSTPAQTTTDPVPDAVTSNPPANTQPELSKRQKKKILKLQQFEERKKALRKREKLKRKEKLILMKQQGEDLTKLGPSRKALKKNKFADNPAEISVAVDLSFDELMSDKDLSSCASQLMRMYTNNRRAKRPIPLHFTSLDPEGRLYKKLERNEGWKNWDVVPHKEGFLELFDKEKIIYLTSESETVLNELEKDAVYIIGGLVDHNHHKFLTQNLATKQGIRTARLPLSEFLVMSTRTVLTINQCFEIILGVCEGRTWRDVLISVMPQRKKIKERKVEEKNDAEEMEDIHDSRNSSQESI